MKQYLDAQIRELDALGATATLQDVAAAFARPMVRALAAGGHELAVMRTVARVGIDPPQGWERLAGKFDHSRRIGLRTLTANLPGIDEQELIFRTRCAAGMLNWLALAPIGTEFAAMPAEQIERRLVPVVAGAFQGAGAVPERRSPSSPPRLTPLTLAMSGRVAGYVRRVLRVRAITAAASTGSAATMKQIAGGSRPSSRPAEAVPPDAPPLAAVFTHTPARVRAPRAADSSATRYAVANAGETTRPIAPAAATSTWTFGDAPATARPSAAAATCTGSRARPGIRQGRAPWTWPPTTLPAESAAAHQAAAVAR